MKLVSQKYLIYFVIKTCMNETRANYYKLYICKHNLLVISFSPPQSEKVPNLSVPALKPYSKQLIMYVACL